VEPYKKLTSACAVGLALLCTTATGQQLPKSGTIIVHTGFKTSGEVVEVAQKHPQGHGSSVGVSYNEQAGGPLDGGPVACFWTFFVIDSGAKSKGYCAFGDPDGDRIFVDWSGAASQDGSDEGVAELAGGTGKYAGIQGNGEWKCKVVGPNGQENCTQRFNYRFPQ
jgi:hypothetical protein